MRLLLSKSFSLIWASNNDRILFDPDRFSIIFLPFQLRLCFFCATKFNEEHFEKPKYTIWAWRGSYIGVNVSTVKLYHRIYVWRENKVFYWKLIFQIKRFQEKNKATLTTAKREVKQAIESAEANIAWMSNYYEEISNWLLAQRNKDKVYKK